MHSTVTKQILPRLLGVVQFKNNDKTLLKTRNYESINHKNSNRIKNRPVLFIFCQQQKSAMGPVSEL